MPATTRRSSKRAPWAGVCRRVGNFLAHMNATSKQQSALLRKLRAKFHAPRICWREPRVTPKRAPSRVTYIKVVRRCMENPRDPEIPSSAPPQNSALKPELPLSELIGNAS